MVALWVRFAQKQPARPGLWPGMVCALAGLAVAAQFWKGVTLDPIGVVSAVAGGAALACYYVMGEHGQRVRDPISLMGLSFGVSAILWAVVSPWWTFPFGRLAQPVELPGAVPGSAPLWLLVLWIVVLGSVVPFLFLLLAVARIEPARVALICMFEPIGGGIAAWILLGESLNASEVAGSCIVLLGIVLAESSRRAAKTRARRPASRRMARGIPRRASPLPQVTEAGSMPIPRATGRRSSPTSPQSSRPAPSGGAPERRSRAIQLARHHRRDRRRTARQRRPEPPEQFNHGALRERDEIQIVRTPVVLDTIGQHQHALGLEGGDSALVVTDQDDGALVGAQGAQDLLT
jgi:hypothetical protein